MRLLIIHSTIDGHTLEICERIASIAREGGHEVELAEVGAASGVAVMHVDQGQRPEDHERGAAGDGHANEAQGEEQQHQNSAEPGARG